MNAVSSISPAQKTAQHTLLGRLKRIIAVNLNEIGVLDGDPGTDFGRQFLVVPFARALVQVGANLQRRFGAPGDIHVHAKLVGDLLCDRLCVKGDAGVGQWHDGGVIGPFLELFSVEPHAFHRVLYMTQRFTFPLAPGAVFTAGVHHRKRDVARVATDGVADDPAFIQPVLHAIPQAAMGLDRDRQTRRAFGVGPQFLQFLRPDNLHEIQSTRCDDAGQRNGRLRRACVLKHIAQDLIGECRSRLRHAITDIEERSGHLIPPPRTLKRT